MVMEKPSVARDIGNFLIRSRGLSGKLEQDASGFGYWLPSGEYLGYTAGHIVSAEMPDVYLTPAQLKMKAFDYLPILPPSLKTHPRYKMKKDGTPEMRDGKPVIDPLYKMLEKMLLKADIIINAGDEGREGQFIMDELFLQVGLDPRAPHIKRIRTAEMSDQFLAESFANIMQNGDPKWYNLGRAGFCRAEADWKVGFNASRVYQQVFNNKYIALGRLKSPVLALVSNRCMAIEAFKPVNYFVPIVTLDDGLEMRWKSREGSEGRPGFDTEGRIIDEMVGKAIVDRINAGAQGKVINVKNNEMRVGPPKPFSLVTLQSEASRKLGCTTKDVSVAAQALYEKHKMISYVGTESNFYPEAMLADAREIMANLSPMFRKVMEGADSSRVPKSFDDKKIDEHHAIAPKQNANVNTNLTEIERGVFELIARRFAAQFYPDHQYNSVGITMQFEQDKFEAHSKVVTVEGWRLAEGISEDSEEEDNMDMSADAPAERQGDRAAPASRT